MSDFKGRPIGENVKLLAIKKYTRDAIPKVGGLSDGIRALSSPNLSKDMKTAFEWAFAAIDAVKNAKDPNAYRDASDEAIAARILSGIKGLQF